ncbi:MAG: hypothetical protein HY686_04075 [Chloroflexi bacterium]|nr:hypothetical protein [Chloroflexota bacterium]
MKSGAILARTAPRFLYGYVAVLVAFLTPVSACLGWGRTTLTSAMVLS